MQEYLNQIEAKSLVKWGRAGLILLVVFLGAQTLVSLKELRSTEAAYSTIVVSGYGEAFAVPDVATFSFSVSTDAPSVAEAQNTTAQRMEAVLASLESLGVEEKDIRTTNYSVFPKYTYVQGICVQGYCPPGRQIPDGYTVSHSVDIKVRNVDDAGEILTAAGESGATSITALNFTVEDPNMLEAEARDMAVKEAREKAKVLAKSLGVKLGRVVDFNDGYYNGVPYGVRALGEGMGGDSFASAPLPTGESRFVSNVTITYEIR